VVLPSACDLSQTIQQCLNAPAAPSVAQYGANVDHVARNLVGNFLDGGPFFWLALVVVVLVLHRVIAFVALTVIAARKEFKK
jgi:hypothetical protein